MEGSMSENRGETVSNLLATYLSLRNSKLPISDSPKWRMQPPNYIVAYEETQ